MNAEIKNVMKYLLKRKHGMLSITRSAQARLKSQIYAKYAEKQGICKLTMRIIANHFKLPGYAKIVM